MRSIGAPGDTPTLVDYIFTLGEDVYKRQVLNGSHIVGHNEIVVQVFDDAQVEDALPGMNVADVGNPLLIGTVCMDCLLYTSLPANPIFSSTSALSFVSSNSSESSFFSIASPINILLLV